ncbi:Ubiquinone biosynthesis protein coq9, mitochondrial [Neolecta irregularis DAH-3]|uniref:Ubiquinone biosynthesis protein n=1 Tax=Neolecta irregularis (strain DAH-3) TaxID=1198029 RepID=A0A1U7LJ01_NEOID|nr:Ubiquinone biosynthesis protein coq9, mitochondrial [Neolecta irregularis DAH-3]|eukprot:OLL22501.1 Ubiquinone biosynthesis protein coq9, mitochondrial [Neolecta irregularis DAH-3]
MSLLRTAQRGILGRTTFHSHAHPVLERYTPTQLEIFSSAMKQVPKHGFVSQTISLGARDAGYLEASHVLFPRGGWSLVEYYLVTERLRLSSLKKTIETEEVGTSNKIRRLIKERLERNKDIIDRWPEALAVMAMPSNLSDSLAELARLSDDLWHIAGDTSADMSWYSKRASLCAVYASTELFMTQDKSPEFVDTWKFLDRRLENVQNIGRAFSEASIFLGFNARSAFNVWKSFRP